MCIRDRNNTMNSVSSNNSNDSSLLKKYGSGQAQSTDPVYIDKYNNEFRESRAWLSYFL